MLTLTWLFCLNSRVAASVITLPPDFLQPTRTVHGRGEKAIEPTSAGQIGVNPVESDLGDANTYIGVVYGTDTLYITVTDTVTNVSCSFQ